MYIVLCLTLISPMIFCVVQSNYNPPISNMIASVYSYVLGAIIVSALLGRIFYLLYINSKP